MKKKYLCTAALALSTLMLSQSIFAAATTESITEPVAESAAESASEAVADVPETGSGIFAAIAGKDGTTYENFFDVTLDEKNYDLWYDCCAAVAGESAAEDTVAFMQGYISSDRYGEEAQAYYAENPDETPVFDCFYINGVKYVTFNPDYTITVELEDGTTETHEYDYIGVYNIGTGETMTYMGQEISVEFPCDVYQSTDEAGEFNYFFLRDDTMEETGHIEFRYGKDLEELQGYFTGPYGYWLTAGFDVNADDLTLRKTIELFCLENMGYDTHTDEAVAQIADLIGTWKADLSDFGDAYADTDLVFTIDENGHGETTMNGEQTADFEAYAYDNNVKGDGVGLYVAYSNLEQEAEAADYTLETNADGDEVLTFYATDGVISYVRQAAEDENGAAEAESAAEDALTAGAAEDVTAAGAEAESAVEAAADAIEISTAEELAAINDNLAGNYVLTADIDLGGAEWTPIGSFVQMGQEGEEAETPNPEYAFTGTFNGNGHTISNFVIHQPEAYCIGLFGCVAGATISELNVENAEVEGTTMVSCVVGYANTSTIDNVNLFGGKVTAYASEMSAEGMYGGIVGAGMGSMLINCSASADIVIPDNTANAGIVGGGLEMTSLLNCSGTGSITAGNNCYGLGGVSGCGFASEEFIACNANDVTITAGDNCFWIGGITGYAGGFEDESLGMPVTSFEDCAARFVKVETGENAEGIGEIVGAGFYHESLAESGAPFDAPTVYTMVNCVAENYVTE